MTKLLIEFPDLSKNADFLYALSLEFKHCQTGGHEPISDLVGNEEVVFCGLCAADLRDCERCGTVPDYDHCSEDEGGCGRKAPGTRGFQG